MNNNIDFEHVLNTVKEDGEKLKFYKEYQNNKEIVLAAVKNDGLALEFSSPELKADIEVVLAAVKENGCALQYAYPKFKKDGNVVILAIRSNSFAILYVDPQIENYGRYVFTAVELDPGLVEYLTEYTNINPGPEITSDKNRMAFLIKENFYAFSWCDKTLKNDQQFIMNIINGVNCHFIVGSLDETAENYKDILIGCVKKYPSTLYNTNLTNDKDVILAAISSDGYEALKYASTNLRSDKQVVMAALNNNKDINVVGFINPILYDDEEVIETIVKIGFNRTKYVNHFNMNNGYDLSEADKLKLKAAITKVLIKDKFKNTIMRIKEKHGKLMSIKNENNKLEKQVSDSELSNDGGMKL